MATPEDLRINAEHLQMADQFVEVPGGTNNNNYANVRLIVQMAEWAQVDAVWPGWGHASEIPELPRLLGLTPSEIRFLGPGEEAMAALGDKVGSSIFAQAAGVPTIPWSGSHVKMSFADCGGTIPKDAYDQACVNTVEEALESCSKIGYPVMLKASWGGGGKGIRKVASDSDVKLVFKQIQGEVPGSPIFAMKLAAMSRHLEVQLLCDRHGNVASLYSRDCSLQRRHQKIVEEGPVIGVDPELLREMERCARELAKSVNYVGAATVEYLYDIVEGKYYFLELNPRLQVEHPVTEGITGVNVPACQVMVGMGIPLYRIPEIRALYCKDPNDTDPIDFENDLQKPTDGHVVAVRITSENAANGFKPTSGRIDELLFRPTPTVWGYFSVKPGGGIHEYSDSQFGHLFAKGSTRGEAISSMVVALKELKIRGEIRTTVDYLIEMIQDHDFVEQKIHTGWLDNRIAAQIGNERAPWHISLVAGVVLKAMAVFSSRSADYKELLEKGQIPPSSLSLTHFEQDLVLDGFKYRLHLFKQGPCNYRVALNGSYVEVVARRQADGVTLLQVDGEKHVVHAEEEPMGTRLSIGSWTSFLAKEHDPSQLLAPSPGRIVRYLVPDGSHVEADQPYVELEVMKMLMPVLAPAGGTVHFKVPEGATLSAGDLFAQLDLDDPAAVVKAEASDEKFPELGPPLVQSERVDHRFKKAYEAARNILAGYDQSVEWVVDELLRCLDDQSLAPLQWSEQYAVVEARLEPALKEALQRSIVGYEAGISAAIAHLPPPEFPARILLETMHNSLQECPIDDRATLLGTLEPLIRFAEEHSQGNEGYACRVAKDLLDTYLNVEEKFLTNARLTTEQEIIDSLRVEHSGSLKDVLDLVLSHLGVARKSKLVNALLTSLVLPAPAAFRPQLRRLTALSGKPTEEVVLRAQHLLEQSLLGDLRAVVARALSGLDMFSIAQRSGSSHDGQSQAAHTPRGSPMPAGRVPRKVTTQEGLYRGLGNMGGALSNMLTKSFVEAQKMAMLVEAAAAVDDALALLLGKPGTSDDSGGPGLPHRALMTYIKRIYHPHILREPTITTQGDVTVAVWVYDNPQCSGTSAAHECHGVFVCAQSLSQFPECLALARQALASIQTPETKIGTFHMALVGDESKALDLSQQASVVLEEGALDTDATVTLDGAEFTTAACRFNLQSVEPHIQASVQAATDELQSMGFMAVSILLKASQLKAPLRKGYWWDAEVRKFCPDPTLRQVEPPVALALELSKLRGCKPEYAPSRNRQWHTYTITECKESKRQTLKRLFLRGLIRQVGGTPAYLAASYDENEVAAATAIISEIEDTLVGCLEELMRIQRKSAGGKTGQAVDWTHIFLAVLPTITLYRSSGESGGLGVEIKVASALKLACAGVMARRSSQLRQASVAQLEIRLRALDNCGAWRVVVSLPTGHETSADDVAIYREKLVQDANGQQERVYESKHFAACAAGPLDGQPVLQPYGPLDPLEQKRLQARRLNTTYCYDFPRVFDNALREIWSERARAGDPGTPPVGYLVEAEELGLAAPGKSQRLEKVSTPIGQNKIGMVAWLMTLKTPERPQGRKVVAVSNDTTFQYGAFGPKEDALFEAAVNYALAEKLPVVYLAANSGARVGLANEVKAKLKVEWVNHGDPTKGFQYLYLEDADYQDLLKQAEGAGHHSIVAEEVASPEGGRRWKITDVIGLEDGLGIECLSGSGAIASAYNRAFREGFTITLVTGQSVGIGAYLARLGRRCVQRSDHPIILTGFRALNKLLGREVYTSHMQLGGPRVMGVNGVSHHIVDDDLEGAKVVLRWLSYAPPVLGGSPLPLPSADPVNRMIGYAPGANEKLDARKAIGGYASKGRDVAWVSGLFDKGSWMEAQAGWARTVVTGRARLGGIPVGVIGVESQTVMKNVPADPGMLESSEQMIPQASQVGAGWAGGGSGSSSLVCCSALGRCGETRPSLPGRGVRSLGCLLCRRRVLNRVAYKHDIV
eukprot:evm.model.scf_1945.1 EVM.evm.TU.scf_1945.1   scf_1945:1899-19188(+)